MMNQQSVHNKNFAFNLILVMKQQITLWQMVEINENPESKEPATREREKNEGKQRKC